MSITKNMSSLRLLTPYLERHAKFLQEVTAKNYKKCWLILMVLLFPCISASAAEKSELKIGMNLPNFNYFSPGLIFSDVMTAASEMLAFPDWNTWDSGLMNHIPVDQQGWPLEVPYIVEGVPQHVRFLINNYYHGDYIVLFEGKGEISWNNVKSEKRDGITHLFLNGKGGHVWANIMKSEKGDHIRNMRIIPAEYQKKEDALPRFNPLYLKGLAPFHALRFMDFTNTNNSKNRDWGDRSQPDYYTQGLEKGVAWEYAIELANILHEDPWICIPHKASDDYIKHLAQLFHDKLDPGLKLYVEFSNEMWNWMFSQATYILNNAPGHPDAHVSADLAKIGPTGSGHPEKDAYMMARAFKIFASVYSDRRDRLVNVAAIQVGWIDTFQRVMKYLFETDGVGADVISPTAYICGISDDMHARWNSLDPAQVTPQVILDFCKPTFQENLLALAETAKKYKVDIVVYEGGQHLQPHNQGEWKYNQAVYDAQIHPLMYERYMQNFSVMNQLGVKLFMAYNYLSARKERWGSWGHLEKVEDVNSSELLKIAPKYQALLDINIKKQEWSQGSSQGAPTSLTVK